MSVPVSVPRGRSLRTPIIAEGLLYCQPFQTEGQNDSEAPLLDTDTTFDLKSAIHGSKIHPVQQGLDEIRSTYEGTVVVQESIYRSTSVQLHCWIFTA